MIYKNKYNAPAIARFSVLALLVFCGLVLPQRVTAQGYYTLTNGTLWWSNGLENQPDVDWRDTIAYDSTSTGRVELHPHGSDHLTEITAKGDTYLALDTAGTPRIVTRDAFDVFCAWYRTGNTGYYYQEWYDTTAKISYRYYIIGSSELVGSVDNPSGLMIVRSEVGKPLTQSTYWYNWDFGAAAWEKPIIGGVQQDRYYWIMLDTLDEANNYGRLDHPFWRLSGTSYERPEIPYYRSYANDPMKYYYDDVNDNNLVHHPAGNGALFLPVTVKAVDKKIISIDIDNTTAQPYGLQNESTGAGINVKYHGRDSVITRLDYNPSTPARADLTVNITAVGNKVPMTVTPAYTFYGEETYRRGIHPNYRLRGSEGVFGSAGQAQVDTHYYWGGRLYSVPPANIHDSTTVDTVIYSIENHSRRYVTIEVPDNQHPERAELVFDHPTMGTHDVEIYVTVRYKNGAEQYDTTTLTLRYDKPSVDPKPVNGPVVRGAVFGGGRMANVGGGTAVYIHAADSIQTVYGGNDVAGWVQGDAGAHIQIGTDFTSAAHPVHIGNVYGGGNGYYTYQGINAGYDEAQGTHINPYFWNQSTALIYQAYYFNGKVYPWNTLPQRDTYMGSAADADRLNHDTTAWRTAGLTPVVDQEFAYTPYSIGRPDLVDQNETGADGNGTIPYIKTAHITVGVPEGTATTRNAANTADSTYTTFFLDAEGDSTYIHNDYVLIDTLFGGARNAFIGVTASEGEKPENGVSIDINGGTIFSVFGGNNVGGSVANTSTVFVNVHDTKLVPPTTEVEDTWLNGYGRDFGIRYLFGGGNLVEGSHANVTITGGMLDTVYLGGNRASVRQPYGTIECLRNPSNPTIEPLKTGYGHFGYNGHFICTNPSYPTSLVYDDPVKKVKENPDFFNGFGPDHLVPEQGMYNIRCLFGGNNAADMDNQTVIMLHSGGISTVYGGGNEGDMNNDQVYTVVDSTMVPLLTGGAITRKTFENEIFPDPVYNYYIQEAFDINYVTRENREGGWSELYGRSTMPRICGAIVTALDFSKIVCDYVYGGSRKGNVKHSCGVYLAGGIYGYVNGGNDVSGDIGSETGGNTNLVLNDHVLVVGDAMGGSDGYYHCDDGTGHYDDQELYDTYSDAAGAILYDPYNEHSGLLLPTHNNVNVYFRDGLILGQLIGGGVHANVGFDSYENNFIKRIDTVPTSPTYGQRVEDTLRVLGGEKSGSIHLMAKDGRVMGHAFGGGYQSNTFGLAYLTLKDSLRIDGSFFSGNDCTGSINAFGAYINPDEVLPAYAAGMSAEDSAAALSAAMDAAYGARVASDGSALNTKDAGGTWTPNYSAYLRIKGTPRITSVYGSGNGAYDYDGSRPEYEPVSVCPDISGYGITPLQTSTFIDINTSGPHYSVIDPVSGETIDYGIDTVFGGGNGVGVREDVVVLLNNTSEDVHAVHTIFGGNNRDDMNDVVPEIRLLKGQVNTVFGGANMGAMGAKWGFVDANGDSVKNVSTHVRLESDMVTVHDTIFGGCRMSDVKGSTFVEVLNTRNSGTYTGVNYIFGGNDISGNIEGNTRVDVSGGVVKNLFGGSNGHYDFVEIGDNEFKVYPWRVVTNMTSESDTAGLLITIAGRPDVDSTSVNLWGGTVGNPDDENGGVYGGGAMADCRATSVILNDTIKGNDRELTILGTVYGGGMGDYENLNARDLDSNRYGNISGATHVHLYHADAVTSAKAYGGGRGGDVMHTYINTYPGWHTPFEQLYGGCWGSDVHGTAHLDFAGIDLVRNLYGGNDFAGDVYRTEIYIHSGIFGNIFGAGNGDYPDSLYIPTNSTNVYYGDRNNLRRPNTEYVNLTIDDGEVTGSLYGGGRMGTTYTYQKVPSTGLYVHDVNGHKVPDTVMAYDVSHINPLDYGYVITNIHGGYFHNSVFGGARGNSSDKKPLVYGLKVLNIDGGEIRMNLYGGSESVNDGYVHECVDKDHTSLRPSSIVNITGGIVEGNLYGAGYLGTTYGSVYVNVGTDAIDSCEVFSGVYPRRAGVDDSLYAIFKPGVSGGLVPALGKSKVVLNHSIYAGANWGAGTGNANFFTPGFKGGESRINVDGNGYNTGVNELNSLPQMNIKKSLFGSGTSVIGGDVYSHIDLWNYGELEGCTPTKELESVQRADGFFSHNTAVHYVGATDATSAYVSAPYSIMRIDTMSFRGFNVAQYDASLNMIEDLRFYEENLDASDNLVLVPVQELRDHTSPDACGNTADICGQTAVVSATDADMKHTLMILNNGIDFNLQTETEAGHVSGFGYVATPVGYSSSITGQATVKKENGNVVTRLDESTTATSGDWLDGYAGFASPCNDSNQYTTQRGEMPVTWIEAGETGYSAANSEYPYTNFIDNDHPEQSYREWKVGKGIRLRETAILAHADPTKLDQDVNIMLHDTSLALARASITLPATSTGHYYRFSNTGIQIAGSSSSVNLVDEAWYTATDFATLATAYGAPEGPHTDVSGQGQWKQALLDDVAQSTHGLTSGASQIVTMPDNTFGLLLIPGSNFETSAGHYVMPSVNDGDGNPVTESLSNLVLSGNAYYNASADYCSPKVKEGERVMPTMDFLLTYNPNFATTFLGTVEFTLDEYDAAGNLVGPVRVKAYISTIIEEFRPIETNVLAMFNNGQSNTFTRRVILPITIDENRELYITSIKWEPTDGIGQSTPESEKFYLTEKPETITGAGWDPLVKNRFGLWLNPNDAVTGDLNENLGWTSIDRDSINLFTLARAANSDPAKFAADGNATVPLATGSNPHGVRVGVLDGRGTAAINVNLMYDGERTYPANGGNGYLGKAVLGMRWIKGADSGDFNFTIFVKTRDHGDTIYIATANSVTREGYTVKPFNDPQSEYYLWVNASGYSGSADSVDKAPSVIGKTPNSYVQSFQHALSSNVYQEGDVIAILDKVEITSPVHIQGADGPAIQVIRYDGHHHYLPNDVGVYRGPMIEVSGNGTLFTAQNIDFHGSAGALTKVVVHDPVTGQPVIDANGKVQITTITYGTGSDAVTRDKQPDTNQVFAPIIVVKNNGAVTLSEGTMVRHNWNEYGSVDGQTTSAGLPANPEMMGAISVTDGGTLTLKGDVSINYNLGHTFDGDISGTGNPLRPYNGAVYVDGGTIVLPQSNNRTAIDITTNRLVDHSLHDANSTLSWWQMKSINGIPSRYALDTSVTNHWQAANVFLTRTEPTSGDQDFRDLNDLFSDNIQVSGVLGTNTRIGVRKWFPGPDTRDTIRFAINTGADFTIMEKAYQNHNFQSDDGFDVFYNAAVNNVTEYLFRCATFKHQWNGGDLLVASNGLDGYGKDVLSYGILASNSCPTGGDSIIYRIQGGFAPYSYTWEQKNGSNYSTIREYTSLYPNTVVTNAINAATPDYNPYLTSIADTLLTPPLDMPRSQTNATAELRVSALDVTGKCLLTKNITVNIVRGSLDNVTKWQPVVSPNGWTDTNTYVVGDRVTAEGTRYYRSIVITPYVSYDPSVGRITAVVPGEGNDQVYQYIDDENRNDLTNLLFCEGDQIRLMTQPTIGNAEFLMWSFDPFNNNPATYVVPSHDEDVIAYYSSKIYWSDTIDLAEEAGVANAGTYNYTSRPSVTGYTLYSGNNAIENYTMAGYVTTYQGDVHIYNENGLAWFISVVNGLNGYQARPFQFNTVYLHKKPQVDDGNGNMVDDPYDMQKFLWSPLGTRQYGFRGRLVGVGSGETTTTPLADEDRVIIRNIVLNEPKMNYVGFFGLLQGAQCSGVSLQNIFVRGGQYVGGFAAQSEDVTTIDNCAVENSGSGSSIITTNYVGGGMVGDATNSTVTNSTVKVKYTGNAVYSGGVTGTGESDTIMNNVVQVDTYASGIYVGGATGNSDGEDDQRCHLSNLTATVSEPTVTSDGSMYTVQVTWQTDATNVEIGYCPGDDWNTQYEMRPVPADSIGNYNLEIIADTNRHYTIAVKAHCNDTSWNMMTTTVSMQQYVEPEPCPAYSELAAQVVSGNGSSTLHVTWRVSQGNQTASTENVRVGYCTGTTWSGTTTGTSTYASTAGANGVDFTLSGNLDTAYTVALYSPCNDRWYTYTFYRCPAYEIVNAFYETTPTGAHTVKLSWRNRVGVQEDNVEVGICPGTTWISSTQMTQISPTSNISSDSICSYTFTLESVSSYAYTVALKSPCSGRLYTQLVELEIPYGCPTFTNLTAAFQSGNSNVNLTWSSDAEFSNGETVMVSICPGNVWDNTNATSLGSTAVTSTTNGYSCSMDVSNVIGNTAYANVNTYTVMLKSTRETCSNTTATASFTTGATSSCPTYTLGTPTYTAGSDDMTQGNGPSVTMTWSVNTPSADAVQIMVGICAGSQWTSDPVWLEPTSGTTTYTFSGDHLPALGNDRTYTVALKSLCDQTVVCSTFVVPNNLLGPLADDYSRHHTMGRKSSRGGRSVIANNYVLITGNSRSQRIGGIAGRAANTDIMNNYVYGTVGGSETGGSVTAVMEQGTYAQNNFTAHGTANKNVGRQYGGMLSNSAGFEGSGNHVVLDRSINGMDNLTRVLNRWVREQNAQGGHYKTWRSDLNGINHGYPVFGTPDLIPVDAEMVLEGCSEVELDGVTYTRDTVVVTRIVDSVEMVDSTITATIHLHYATYTMVSDSVDAGRDYHGYGFFIGADELRMLDQTLGTEGRASIILQDTLTGAYGCDSIVILTLTFKGSHVDIPEVEVETGFSVNVYPNPTTGLVNVEAEGMTHVEVYDNEGRRLQDYSAYGADKLTIDMTRYATGVYFVRVHSPKAIVIQKVIRER